MSQGSLQPVCMIVSRSRLAVGGDVHRRIERLISERAFAKVRLGRNQPALSHEQCAHVVDGGERVGVLLPVEVAREPNAWHKPLPSGFVLPF